MKRAAVLLDRDGTILNERGYLGDPNDIQFYKSAAAGLRRLQKAGFRLVIVSNQSGIGRGYFTREDFGRVSDRFTAMLRRQGVRIDGIYFCPHLPDAECECRKPKIGMARRAARDLNLDLRRSYVIGDQLRDVELARNIGARGVLVLTGAGRRYSRRARSLGAKVTRNVVTAARWITTRSNSVE
jgi:histidinol-phosphate phosphatase family protein